MSVVVDPIDLPFASGSIDGVVLHHAVDLVADRRGTLREVARVLKSGGQVGGRGIQSAESLALDQATVSA